MFSGPTNLLGRAVSGVPTQARPGRPLLQGLLGDIAALKPTMFVGVPRVFDRIYTSVMGKTKAAVRLTLWPPASLLFLSQARDSASPVRTSDPGIFLSRSSFAMCTSALAEQSVQQQQGLPLHRACSSSRVCH